MKADEAERVDEQVHDLDLEESAGRRVTGDAARYRRRTALVFLAAGLGVVAGVWVLSGVVGQRREQDLLAAQAEALGAYTHALADAEGTELAEAVERRLLRRVLPEGVFPTTDDGVAEACRTLEQTANDLEARQQDLSACEDLSKYLPGCQRAYDTKRVAAGREELAAVFERIDGCVEALDAALEGSDAAPQLAPRGNAPPLVSPLDLPPLPKGYAHIGERPQLYVGERIQLVEPLYRPECGEATELRCRAFATHELRDGEWNTEKVAISPMLDETGDQVTLADIEPLGEWTRGTVVDGPGEKPGPITFDQGGLRLIDARGHLIALPLADADSPPVRRLGRVSGRCTVRYAAQGTLGVVCMGANPAEAKLWLSVDGGRSWQPK